MSLDATAIALGNRNSLKQARGSAFSCIGPSKTGRMRPEASFSTVWALGIGPFRTNNPPPWGCMPYRCEVPTIAGFVQQVAVGYLSHGYFFYVAGVIPPAKDPRRVDEKLIERYGLDVSKWARARRKRVGLANVAYLRHERFFVLLATAGRHRFFDEESSAVRDLRREPLRFASYAISHRGGHPHVRIAEPTMRDLKERLRSLALQRSVADLTRTLHALPFEPYAPVRGQFCELLRLVNRARSVASLEQVPKSALRLRRSPVRVFESERSESPAPSSRVA